MSSKYGHLQSITDMLLPAIEESLAGVGQRVSQWVPAGGVDRLCESCGEVL
mgnify:FL=1